MPARQQKAQNGRRGPVFSGRRTATTRPPTPPLEVSAPEVPPEKAPFVSERKRCPNCGAFFWTKQAHQRFDKEACRKEFHKNGAGFGKLREQLPKLIEKCVQRELDGRRAFFEKMVAERYEQTAARLNEVETDLENLRGYVKRMLEAPRVQN